jgi:hypothetical protein
MPKPVAFIAYPSQPSQVGGAIDAAVQLYNRSNLPFLAESWRQIDIAGRFIIDGILDKIQTAPFVVADLTRLNFNVTFEVGYAMGRGKRVVLVLNRATEPETKDIMQLGIFDTLGYSPYSNAQELFSIMKNVVETSPLRFPAVDIDRSAPIYLLDTFHKTDAALRIVSRIKKSRLHFRSFDPKEQPRLATSEAMRNVRASIAVVVNLLSYNSTDHRFNNLRGAFLAGLAMGADKETLILQEGEEPVPVDYRDLVRVYRHPDDIDPLIAELVPKVTERL